LFVAAPIVNGNFVAHTPVMWTPPTYDDLMARDAVIAVILLKCEQHSSRRVLKYDTLKYVRLLQQ